MIISKLTTDNGARALELVQQVKATTLKKWCLENDLEVGRKAEMQERLSTAIINQIIAVEQHDPRIQIWPDFRYSCVAQLHGLDEDERLNILEWDDREEWDELFDDLPTRLNGPMDKQVQIAVLEYQILMEWCLLAVDRNTSPVFERRNAQRAALDRRMKAWHKAGCPRDPAHKALTSKMMAVNTRLREAAKEAGREEAHPQVVKAWEDFKTLKEQMEKLMGTAKGAYYGYVADVAPFVPKGISGGEKYKMRHKRIKWLKAAILELETELELEDVDHLSPNWITRDDDESRRYDDFIEHSKMLNRGEDMRDAHCREMWDGRPDVHLKLVWRKRHWEVTRGEQAYWDWLTQKYQAWWAATQAQRCSARRR